MFVVLLGPPGAGKGTQAMLLAEALGLPHISTGNLLREAIRLRTSLGQMAERFINKGELVPDEAVLGLVAEELARVETRAGAVFDGYPRSVAQAQMLDRELARRGRRLMRALGLEVGDESIVERLSSRLTCAVCATPYNLLSEPPRRPGICDNCGGRLVRRPDDEPEVIRRRLVVYRTTTLPLEDYYRRQDLLVGVDGDAPLATVTAALLSALSDQVDDARVRAVG